MHHIEGGTTRSNTTAGPPVIKNMCTVKTQIIFIIRFVKQICVQFCVVETKVMHESPYCKNSKICLRGVDAPTDGISRVKSSEDRHSHLSINGTCEKRNNPINGTKSLRLCWEQRKFNPKSKTVPYSRTQNVAVGLKTRLSKT